MNYISSNLFVISADDDLDKIQSRLYGYQATNGSIDIGHYVRVRCDRENINLFVDKAGMGLLFEYRCDGYWAYSNSFVLLAQYISRKNKALTINREYIALFAKINSITTVSYKETLFKEITLVPSNREIRIFKATKGVVYKNWKENSHIQIGTPESFEYIDRWANRWISFLRYLVKNNYQVNLQLSGGFDSRVVLALALASNINFNYINIESSTSMLEDLEIAKQICSHFKLNVNSGLLDKFKKTRISRSQEFYMNLYYRGCLHKEFLPPTHYRRFTKPVFIFSGYGNMRGWFNDSDSKYYQYICKNSLIGTDNIQESLKNILYNSINEVYERMNYEIPIGRNFMNFVYNYTRGRYNYGTSVMASASMNQFICSPILDLQQINPLQENSNDFNLLFAYIYNRFAPDLLNFPFSGNRCIDQQTIDKAKSLNKKRFLIETNSNEFNISLQDIYLPSVNENINELTSIEIMKWWLSCEVNRKAIAYHIGSEYYDKALQVLSENKRHSEKEIFCLFALVNTINNTLKQPTGLIY